MYEKVSAEMADIQCVSNSHLKGTIETNSSDYLCFTIPISPDSHTIEMIYISQGLIVGIIISFVSLVVCVVLYIRKKEKND